MKFIVLIDGGVLVSIKSDSDIDATFSVLNMDNERLLDTEEQHKSFAVSVKEFDDLDYYVF